MPDVETDSPANAPAGKVVYEVVDQLSKVAKAQDTSLGDLIAEFGTASFATVLLAVSLLLVSPLSGVPLFSSCCGMIIALVAGQGAWGRSQIWMPPRIMRIQISTGRLTPWIAKLRKAAAWLDRRTATRLPTLVTRPLSRGLYGVCCAFGCLLPVLEFVPLSSSLVGACIALIATGLLARDGLFALAGLCGLALASALPVFAVRSVLSL